MRDYSADVIVVGSGVAGLSAALAAAEAGGRVAILTAGEVMAGSSPRAQGGVAAVVGDDDAVDLHIADTLSVGAGLNEGAAVQVLVEEGARIVRELLDGGVPFDGGAAHPELGLEAGHSRRRILHTGGATGWALTSALTDRALAHPNITLHARTGAESLVDTGGRISGVVSTNGTFRAKAVVIATGGYAGLWARTTNAPESRGGGVSLAWQAGATLADLEFVQFHPTAIDLADHPAYLLTEALRGEGGRVVDEREAPVVDPLLPRDVVARAIHRHRRDHGPVFLSLRHLDADFIRARFPTIAVQLDEWGLDLARDLLPIAPAAHYCMGGVRTDTEGRTDVAGLYAAGEVACTGVQGANRLASNSLLECLVFGSRAGVAAMGRPNPLAPFPQGKGEPWQVTVPVPQAPDSPLGAPRVSAVEAQMAAPLPFRGGDGGGGLGDRLDRDLGVERDGAALGELVADLTAEAPHTPFPDTRLAALIAQAALLREESRGAHYRADAPDTDPRWRGRILWKLGHEPRFESCDGAPVREMATTREVRR